MLRGVRLRQRGPAPRLADSEGVTMEIAGEFLGVETDAGIYRYFRRHWPDWFPALARVHRTTFVRQAANLWQVKAAIQRHLTPVSGQADDPVQIIDTLPLPVCGYTRSGRDRCFKPDADYGYCAAKRLKYYGFPTGIPLGQTGLAAVAGGHDYG
jgi:hypothetical protein